MEPPNSFTTPGGSEPGRADRFYNNASTLPTDAMTLSRDEQCRLADLDRRHVWHPFTQHALWNAVDPLIITGGEGEYLIGADGRRYIDGNSSMWCNLHGHRRPEIDRAIIEQLGRVAHSTQLGLASPPAIELARRLVEIAPPGLTRVFYSDDGSTSVEVACKLAFAYWQHRAIEGRDRFIALSNAYHGDTVGAVSVGGIDLFHRVYRPMLFETHFAASPYCYRCPRARGAGRDSYEMGCEDGFSQQNDTASGSNEAATSCCMGNGEEVAALLERHAGRVAAVIVEPLVQCAGGIITAPPGFLKAIRALCDRYNVLLIADEVATGFGRTGRMFACEHESVAPDLLCLSKGLTAGYLPLAATLATEEIYDAFLGPIDSGRTFYHGHTFTGNPLGCAAALASLDIFETDRTLEKLAAKIERLRERLERLKSNVHVGDIRQCGFIAGIELVRDKITREAFPYGMQVGARVCARARDYGVMLRPLADVIVIMPPLIISMENLDRIVDVVECCIDQVVADMSPAPVDGLE